MDPATATACTEIVEDQVVIASVVTFVSVLLARFGSAWLAHRLLWRGISLGQAVRQMNE